MYGLTYLYYHPWGEHLSQYTLQLSWCVSFANLRRHQIATKIQLNTFLLPHWNHHKISSQSVHNFLVSLMLLTTSTDRQKNQPTLPEVPAAIAWIQHALYVVGAPDWPMEHNGQRVQLTEFRVEHAFGLKLVRALFESQLFGRQVKSVCLVQILKKQASKLFF